jgi:hypothetical protein
VQVIGPKLRNACDPGVQGGLMNPAVPNPRSVCDALQDVPNSGARREPGVNWPYAKAGSETWDQASERAVMEACQAGPQGTAQSTNALDYQYQALKPNPDLVSLANGTFTQNGGLCGRSAAPEQWSRWKSTGDYNRVWRFTARPQATSYFGAAQALGRLKLEMFNGPRCDPAQDLRATALPVSSTGSGPPDMLQLLWTVTDTAQDEVCTRLTVADELVRTGYRFERAWP